MTRYRMDGERSATKLSVLTLCAAMLYASPLQFSSTSEMVLLHATVSDRKGGFVTGLKKDNFHVYEDGRPQTISLFQREDQPVSVGLVVDNSGSMRRKRGETAEAALAFVQRSNPADELFVVNFNDSVTLGLRTATMFSTNHEELRMALSNVNTGGRTALYDAVALGIQQLNHASNAKKALLLISDGGDNVSRETLRQVEDAARRSEVILYAIGIFDEYDADRNPKVLRMLAKETGGQAFFPSELSDIVPICERIAMELRNQYTIGYIPTNAVLDGTYRSIHMAVEAPHSGRMTVRTRAGYIASAVASDHL